MFPVSACKSVNMVSLPVKHWSPFSSSRLSTSSEKMSDVNARKWLEVPGIWLPGMCRHVCVGVCGCLRVCHTFAVNFLNGWQLCLKIRFQISTMTWIIDGIKWFCIYFMFMHLGTDLAKTRSPGSGGACQLHNERLLESDLKLKFCPKNKTKKDVDVLIN